MFLEQQISILEMISEGSCDTEDITGINDIFNYIKKRLFICIHISQYYCFTVFLIKYMKINLISLGRYQLPLSQAV